MSSLRRKSLTADERLRRKGQRPSPLGGRQSSPIDNLIVIGASAGGHHALEEIFKRVSPDIPAALVVVLHSSSPNRNALGQLLGRFTPLPMVTVRKVEKLRNGIVYLAPPGRAIRISHGAVEVDADRERTHPVITINRLFESAAKAYGDRVMGVILTGLLRDGTDGLRAVHEAGGLTLVQDPQEAEYADMPASAMQDLPVTFCLNLADIGPALDLLARRNTRLETGVAVSIRTMEDRIAMLVRFISQSKQNEGTYGFLVQELNALKRDLHLVQQIVSETGESRKTGTTRPPSKRKTEPAGDSPLSAHSPV